MGLALPPGEGNRGLDTPVPTQVSRLSHQPQYAHRHHRADETGDAMLAVEQTAEGARVSGVLDVRGVGRVREVLTSLLEATEGDVVLDVSDLDSLDVTGLAVLVAAHRRALRQGRRLVLTGVAPSLARLLAVTRLHRVLVVSRVA